jgi:DNA-binding SARP family transcriptional activator
MGELRVQLLGGLSLLFNGAPLTTFNTPRLQALLAFLILNPDKPQFRYQIAYTFWPESSEAQARTNLRKLIHLLRQALPESDQFIAIETQTLQWRENASYTLDVHEFERLLAPAAKTLPSRESLDLAVRLYEGDLLPSCYDDWITTERERLRRAYLAALESLAEIAESSRDYKAALEFTRRLLESEPLHTRGNQQLIRLYSLENNRPAALEAYQSYARLLKRELDIRPDQETRALAEHLKHQVDTDHGPSAQDAPTILVGRHAEWRRLLNVWQNAATGSPQAVFVTGEAGIGKTRLVEELVQWASRQGIRTAVAHCYPAEGSLPYAPAVDWIKANPLPPLEDVWLVELSRLIPELLQAHPKLASPTALNEAWQRQRLFEALARAILGKRGRLLLVIEDVHWCDQDTLEWLHYLLRFDAQASVLIVATERNEEIMVPDNPVETLQTALKSVEKYTEIELKPLNQAESFQLAMLVSEKVTNQTLNPDLTEYIYRQTEGNPLFVVEMVQLGQILPSQESLSVEHEEHYGRAQAMLKRRINQIAFATRELASLAATIGREFPLDVLRQASEESEGNIVKALDELLRRHIIREISPDTYDFTHDRLRQAVFSGLSTAHRRLLHREVAEAYLRLDEFSSRSRNAEIASHYERAGQPTKAIEYYRLAAEDAAHIFANAEAQRYLQRAIDLAEAMGVGAPNGLPIPEFAVMLERSGSLHLLNGQYLQAQEIFERALAQPFSATGLWRSQVYRNLSSAVLQQNDHSGAHAALDRAEQALGYAPSGGPLEERQEWLQIQIARGLLYYWTKQPDQIEKIMQEITPIVQADGRLDQQIELVLIQLFLRMRRERWRLSTSTLELARLGLDLAEALGDPYQLVLMQFELGFTLLWHGDLQVSRENIKKSYEQANRMGARLLEVRSLAYLAIISRKLGKVELLRHQAQALVEMASSMGEHGYHGVGLACLGWLAWKDGDITQAENLCHSAKKAWDQYATGYAMRWLGNWVLLAIAVSRQQAQEAARWTEALLDPDPTLQPIAEPMASLLQQGLSAYRANDAQAAFQFFNQALKAAQTTGDL